MSDLWKLVQLASMARRGGHALRMPSDFPRTLRIALFRAATAAAVDALDHDARWERFSPTFNMCAYLSRRCFVTKHASLAINTPSVELPRDICHACLLSS